MFSPSTETSSVAEDKDFPPPSTKHDHPGGSGDLHLREISAWMCSLQSFFNLYNHPFPEGSQADLITHDWTNELRIVRGTLLRCSQLVFQSVHFEKADATIFDEADAHVALAPLSSLGASGE